MSPLQLVDVVFPPGQTVRFETAERGSTIHQLVWMIDGSMQIGHGDQRWQLAAGDCLALRLDAPVHFHKPRPPGGALSGGPDRSGVMKIECWTAAELRRHLPELATVLRDCVEGGASVGFMLPLAPGGLRPLAKRGSQIEAGGRQLFVARGSNGEAIGTVSLVTDMPDNQPHRADVAKMLVHRSARRQGVAEALLARLEEDAWRMGKTTLVLDTVSGSAAARLYERVGWQRVGEIPAYALMPDGTPCATTYYWQAPQRLSRMPNILDACKAPRARARARQATTPASGWPTKRAAAAVALASAAGGCGAQLAATARPRRQPAPKLAAR